MSTDKKFADTFKEVCDNILHIKRDPTLFIAEIRKLREYEDEVVNKNKQLDNEKFERDRLEKEIKELKEENAQLKKKIISLTEKVEESRGEVENVKTDVAVAGDKIAVTEDRVNQLSELDTASGFGLIKRGIKRLFGK